MCLYAMDEGILPGTAGLRSTDPEITVPVRKRAGPGNARHMLSNAFGFGGNNSALILSQA
jgi:3-oxoacyl-[acyl-carrier-protein] synthase-1